MSRLMSLIARPFRLLIDPIERVVKAKLAGLIDDRLGPVAAELRGLHEKVDRVLDINLAPEVLSDFRAHNQALRAIQSDCDLLRDLNPMFNTFLRDMVRLEMRIEDLASRVEERAPGLTLGVRRESA